MILKFVRFFCVVAFFECIKCDQLLLENSQDDHLLKRTISCTAACMSSSEMVSTVVRSRRCYFGSCMIFVFLGFGGML